MRKLLLHSKLLLGALLLSSTVQVRAQVIPFECFNLSGEEDSVFSMGGPVLA